MSQHTPGFIFKRAGRKKLNHNPSGKLLLIEYGYTKHDSTYDRKFDHIKFLNNQLAFVDNLHTTPRQELLVRLFNKTFEKIIGVKNLGGMILIQILE